MSDDKHIQVREFDFLTKGGVGHERYFPLSEKRFNALRDFVLENRSEVEDSPLELMRLCSPKGVGEAIQLRNYVGLVELPDGYQIEILPKIRVDGDADEERMVFLRMLRYLGTDVSFKTLDNAHLRSGKAPLFEVFIGMFVAEASDLVRRGLRSAYVEVHSQESFVRGKIDFAKQAKANPAHAERLNLVFDDYLVDRAENRLVKTTLLYLRGATRSGENLRGILKLLPSFDGVGLSHNVDADLARCANNRTTVDYRNLIAWCRVFLKHQSFTMFRGSSVTSALLFPMETVFEEYVGKKLRRAALETGRLESVELQAHGKWLFDNQRVQLRPDILCECNNGRRVVLDTKWKRVCDARDVSVADMYQMYAYGKRYAPDWESRQHVVLLYPWFEGRPGLRPKARHTSGDGVRVDLFFVDVAHIDESLESLLSLIGDPAALEAGERRLV